MFQRPKHESLDWVYQDIHQLTLTAQSIHILSYKDSGLLLDVNYDFAGMIPAALDEAGEQPAVKFAAKLLDFTNGREGTLAFDSNIVGSASIPGDPGKAAPISTREPITESIYNQLWLDIEKKNGRIQ
jgi:hypothetical protein